MFSDCGNGADEDGCTCNSLGLFSCADGTCLSKSLVCDGESHCSAGEDEADCEAVTKKRPGRCEQHQFWCSKTNKCIRRDTVCSSECGPDVCRCAKTTLPICPGIRSYPSPLRFLSDIEVMESDEYSAVSILLRTSCHPWLRELSCGFLSPSCDSHKPTFPCKNLCEDVRDACAPVLTRIGLSWPPMLSCSILPEEDCLGRVHQNEQCPPQSATCSDVDKTCIPNDWRCDGIEHCANGEDEKKCSCEGFECASGRCLSSNSLCNGEQECEDGEDELNCPVCRANEHQCSNLECISADSWCDGFRDCTDASDEVNCVSSTTSGIIAQASKTPSLFKSKNGLQIGELSSPKWNALCQGKWSHSEEQLESLCTRLLLNPNKIADDQVQVSKQCPAKLHTNICPACGITRSRQRRVLSGRVKSNLAPWIASVSIDGHNHWCGGTLITNRIVLSAAHCFYKHQNSDLSKWRVKIGQRSSHSWINIRRVASLTVHPLFQAQSFDFDLSLIKLSQRTSITTSCLPPQIPKPGLYCRVSGWGQVGPGSPGSNKLKSGNVHIVDKKLCESLYPTQVCFKLSIMLIRSISYRSISYGSLSYWSISYNL